MTAAELIAALALPASCRVDQRVPKKMLVEHGAPTAADKRLLNNAIEELRWIAALKPNTVGVPAWHDDEREYLEIAVLSIATRAVPEVEQGSKARNRCMNIPRLSKLVHRAVPYPVLLLLATPQGLSLSAAHKRWALNEASRVVLDGDVIVVALAVEAHPLPPGFVPGLALGRQPQDDLLAIYQGWINCLTALQSARITDHFALPATAGQAQARRAALQEHQQLMHEAGRLRAEAGKARQLAQRVELNLALKQIEQQLGHLRTRMQ